jgi:hypothetical protein
MERIITPYLIVCCAIFVATQSFAQNPLRQHYRGHESEFNPAFTGQVGATRLVLGSRSQWNTQQPTSGSGRGYTSHALNYEEALPCLFFDYGLFVRKQTEGDGQLTTNEFGGRIAAALPLMKGRTDRALNLRFGLALARGQRSVNYNGLIFLDQLNPITGLLDANGNPNLSSVQLREGRSPWYTASSLGIALKGGAVNRRYRLDNRPVTFDLGLAVHNFAGLVSRDQRQSASLIGLDATLRERWVASGSASVVFNKVKGHYWSVHPQIVVQQQAGIGYLEVGAAVSYDRYLELGFYQHLANNAGEGANWSSLRLALGSLLAGEYSRVDVVFSYAFQYGSLKNYVQAPLELTAIYSFGKSVTCLATGQQNDFARGNAGRVDCFSFGTAQNRMYDNIWYD